MQISRSFSVCHALIVEENAAFRQSLREMLRTWFPSIFVEEATDGLEALQKLKMCRPDLVFVNMRLPRANGLEIAKRIRDENEQVVVVVLTSHDLPEYRKAAYESGATHFFAKGISTSDEIYKLVRCHFSCSV